MQTFLAYDDFEKSARVLDMRRLGKQRVEALQILNALDARQNKGWKNHPVTRMWFGYPFVLIEYGLAITTEWIRRGYRDTCFEKFHELHNHGYFVHLDHIDGRPAWLGNELFHRSHQSNLIRKDPKHYGPLFPGVPSDLAYVWPAKVSA